MTWLSWLIFFSGLDDAPVVEHLVQDSNKTQLVRNQRPCSKVPCYSRMDFSRVVALPSVETMENSNSIYNSDFIIDRQSMFLVAFVADQVSQSRIHVMPASWPGTWDLVTWTKWQKFQSTAYFTESKVLFLKIFIIWIYKWICLEMLLTLPACKPGIYLHIHPFSKVSLIYNNNNS